MTLRRRLLYRDAGDHIAFRDASEHVPDVRDHPEIAAQLLELARARDRMLDGIDRALLFDADGKERRPSRAEYEKAIAERAAQHAAHDQAHSLAVENAQRRHQALFPAAPSVVKLPDEFEFDHVPSEAELDVVFPNRKQSAS